MATHKSALKSIRQTEKRATRNKARVSRIRTHIRSVEEAIQAGNKNEALERFRTMQSELIRGVRRNLYHINTAARKISRISTRIKAIQA